MIAASSVSDRGSPNRWLTATVEFVIILNVFFNVRQEHEAEFVALLNHMVIESNKETGCTLYQLFHNDHNRWQYMLVEHWESQAALDDHASTPHWINFDNTVNNYLVSDYEEHHYREIPQ